MLSTQHDKAGGMCMGGDCVQRKGIQLEAHQALQRLIDLTKKQIDALHANDQQRLTALDKELELAFGEKERCFGALWQHMRDHGC
jgi:hypothetical protein